jgi:multidrug efflux pump subunit AcrB
MPPMSEETPLPSARRSFNLSRWAIEHAGLTGFFAVLVIVAGAMSLFALGRKEDPDFTFRVMVVQTVWPGASLHEMQDQVVDKIERKLQETPHLDFLRTYARAGSAVTMVSIRGDAPAKEVANDFYQVRKKVGDIANTLPDGVMGPYFNDEFGDTYIALFSLTGEGFTPAELEDAAKRARDTMLRVPGIEKAQVLGARDRVMHVDVPSRVLAERGLTALSLRDALAGQNAVQSAGKVETSARSVRISVDGSIRTTEDLADLQIRAGSNTIRLGDIATITSGYADPPGQIMRDGGHEAVLLGLVMQSGYNVTKVGEDVRHAIASVEKDLPLGLSFAQVSDQPKVVEESIDEFIHSLGEALLIVLVVSFLSIGWRAGLVVAITIPTVLAATFALMLQLGIDLHRISLGALIIALGLLVDDAMIAVEMMERKLEEGLPKLEAAGFAYTSTAFPMLSGTLITTAGFIPVGFAASQAGEYVSTLFWVVGIALVTSWIAAVYFTPWFGTLLLKERLHPEGGTHELFTSRFYRSLRATIGWAVTHRVIIVLVTVVLFGISVWGFKFVPRDFFPPSSRLEVMVDLWLPEGTSIGETERQTLALEKRLLADPDQQQVTTFIGQGVPRFYLPLDVQLQNANFAQLVVVARDIDARARLILKTRKILAEDFPDIRGKVDQLNMGPPTGWAVQMRVSGPDRTEVRRIADRVKAEFLKDSRLTEVHDDWLEPVPTLRLVVDQGKARALGVTSSTIRQVMQSTFSGAPIGSLRDGENTVSVVFREPDVNRAKPSSIEETYVPTTNGAMIPLAQIARVETVLEPGIEWRRDRLATITVRAALPLGVISNDVTQALYNNLAEVRAGLPLGYTVSVGGAIEESAKSSEAIAAKVPAMLFVMAVLLMFQLQHAGKGLLVLLTAPLGLIGAVAALVATDSAFGFVAILGVVALAGIIMRNSIILIDQIDQDLAAGASLRDAAIEAAVRRFRPIMLTAAAAVLALIPIARTGFWGPMAYAMMGGIIAATVLTILVLPAAYVLVFRRRRHQPDAVPPAA